MSIFRYTLIIPHYNKPDLLRRLLITIPKRDDLQVIVIDDMSNQDLDKLENLKKEYKWIEWYETGINGGGGKARNVGLDKVRGEYVFFADADDFFLPDFNELIDKYKDKKFDILFFDCISLNSITNRISNRGQNINNFIKNYLTKKEKSIRELKYNFPEPWCKIINIDIIKKYNIKFDHTRIHNDVTFSYLTGHYAKDIFIESKAYYCLTNSISSVSKNITPESLLTRFEIFAKKNAFFKKNNIPLFDNLILTPFILIKKYKNPEIKEKLFDLAKMYNYNKIFINSQIIKFQFFKFNNRIKNFLLSVIKIRRAIIIDK